MHAAPLPHLIQFGEILKQVRIPTELAGKLALIQGGLVSGLVDCRGATDFESYRGRDYGGVR